MCAVCTAAATCYLWPTVNLLRVAYFLLFSHLAVVIQYLQVHLDALGFSHSQVGLLMGIFQISGVGGALFFGAVADRHGNTKILLILAIAGSTLLLVSLSARPGLAAAIPIVAATGFLFRSEVPLVDTHASRLLRNDPSRYGGFRVWGSIGWVAISLAMQISGYPRPDIANSIVVTYLALGTAHLVTAIGLPTGGAAVSRRERHSIPVPKVFWVFIPIVVLSNLGFSAHNVFFSLYVKENLPGFLVSGAWAVGAVAEIPVILLSRRLIARLGIGRLLVLAAAGTSVRMTIYALFPQTAPVLAAQLLHALTFGALHVAAMSFITRALPPESQGRAVALYNAFGFGVTGLLGGLIGGQLLEMSGFAVLFGAAAIPPAVAALVGIMARKRIEAAVSLHR